MRRRPALLAFALLALCVLAAPSCSRRERSNPLDAANPESGGAPEGFNAVAGFASVRFVWRARPDLPIDGFRLFRLAPGDSVYRALGSVFPATSSTFLDIGPANGSEYSYRFYYVVDGQLSARFAADAAVPGPVRAYVGDAADGRLLRLAPDARDISTAVGGYGEPFSVAVTPDFGPVWLADPFAGTVRILEPATFTGRVLTGLGAPFTMALDPFDGSAWISDVAGKVHHYQSSGAPAAGNPIDLLLGPRGVATNADDGVLWVAETQGSRVRRYSRTGTPLGALPLSLPSRVAVDSTNGEAWVTSFDNGRLWRVSPSMTVLDSLPLSGPIGIALDWRRRIAWVAEAPAGRVAAIDMDTRVVKFRIGGLAGPIDTAVDLDRGEAWIVARDAGRVYRYSASGVLLGSVGGLGEPYEVRLDRGRL